jgi:hypothetical protein
VFYHDGCRGKRKENQMRYTADPVPDQQLRDMRHKKLCHIHRGHIATCAKCDRQFSVHEIVENAINVHLGQHQKYSFPDGNVKRLDKAVYEMQKNFSWCLSDDYSKAVRYFASNALVNVHFVTHATRCFKKGDECYANLPDSSADSVKLLYNGEPDVWSNWFGAKENRYIFCLQPERHVEDAFMNVHNKTITSLLGCNSNVMLGMNGRAVMYVTGYNTKSQQKEERAAFEKVSEVLIKILQKQVRYYFIVVDNLQHLQLICHGFAFPRNRPTRSFQSNNLAFADC